MHARVRLCRAALDAQGMCVTDLKLRREVRRESESGCGRVHARMGAREDGCTRKFVSKVNFSSAAGAAAAAVYNSSCVIFPK